MPTYFDTVSKSFADVPVTDAGVDTAAFLEASEGVVKLFDLFGSAAFSVVQNDMRGNIEKIKARYNSDKTANATLESLVVNESKEKKRTATEGLLWLLRGLKFTCTALQRSEKDQSEELSVSFTKAYEVTLRQYHSFVVRPVFSLAMKACPYRKVFYEKLGGDAPAAKVQSELQNWLTGLETVVNRLDKFYEEGKHAKGL
ncbi:uncharacterized protein L969DRAFT_85946 [Mixia osmundae IAM 14324]|uniref:Glycolipid transfer protein domain-containing protein n=1 Tax=Mixia osmundae (strain CBS 9802 / IAM 14324 / JCM 22182 / KY 12970) TaxID=764103 RepID=G7E5L6_MIXOS|nr:uncharacterized protein L969DRAFT_85946 [Mixia osmundae IAM 14324]KEI40726.1 hypothetical protein L969DRAFT_85946 [Mixia osmundae IAM 14324]GAA98126.1 hypothetical protein E5Q_04809 [Mixia osmundae IAM 14324]